MLKRSALSLLTLILVIVPSPLSAEIGLEQVQDADAAHGYYGGMRFGPHIDPLGVRFGPHIDPLGALFGRNAMLVAHMGS